MWFKRKPKEIHGIDNIAKFFKISSMDIWTWRRSRADPPPIWIEKAVWCCEIRAMKAWLKENGLMPKKASLLEIIKAERNLKNEKRRVKNNENWQRTISKSHRQDWTVTPDRIKRKRLW